MQSSIGLAHEHLENFNKKLKKSFRTQFHNKKKKKLPNKINFIKLPGMQFVGHGVSKKLFWDKVKPPQYQQLYKAPGSDIKKK